VGPFDYTPKLFRTDRTHAHSTAMLLVYPGPVAILRGTALKRGWGPELAFVQRLPMTYDETKVPVADIGKTLIVARRRGDVWYVAGICGEEGYDAGFRLVFLGRGNTWKAELCTDGANGRAIASVRHVSGGDWFPVKMDKAGGFTLILTRETPTQPLPSPDA
jgi:alpha-glucosidase